MKVEVLVHGKGKTIDDEVVINNRGRTPLSKTELKTLGPQGVGLQVRSGLEVGALKQNYVKVRRLLTHLFTFLHINYYLGVYHVTSSFAHDV